MVTLVDRFVAAAITVTELNEQKGGEKKKIHFGRRDGTSYISSVMPVFFLRVQVVPPCLNRLTIASLVKINLSVSSARIC